MQRATAMEMADDSDLSSSKEHLVSHAHTRPDDHPESVLLWDPPPPEANAPPRQHSSLVARLLRDKGKERERKAPEAILPLHFLDLPVDILRLVVKEITQTNDLTALARTCSTLYNLSIPHIYARFDIVWPDINIAASDSKGVDALTYGLSTLCLGSKFAQRTRWLRGGPAQGGSGSNRFIDNQYAKHTRKFGLGNGPASWISEYNITKESGKMLGTLVALAVAKMVNLETFVWDMPTGVLSDVFMALASLQDHYPDGRPKLDKVHIRWHENWEANVTATSLSSPVVPPTVPVSAVPIQNIQPLLLPFVTHTSSPSPPKYSDSQVEYPTFSVLPPLKSLSVLDIDELAYLDEISILVERSKDTLQELRLGVSQKAMTQDFVSTWEGTNLQQIDFDARWPGESTIGDKRLGGVLGVVVGRIYEIRQKAHSKPRRYSADSITPITETAPIPGAAGSSKAWMVSEDQHQAASGSLDSQEPSSMSGAFKAPQSNNDGIDSVDGKRRLVGKLKLQTLELERITLSMQVCCKAFDWSVLTNLTILNCNQHETLWKVLKRRFQPTVPPHGSAPGTPSQYHLALKRIHSDVTSHALISFIKETLGPNTLESLFLQDRRRSAPPPVSIDTIFKVAVKRHRSSLKKLLIDSNDKLGRESRSEGGRWKHWVLKSDMVCYITSGRLPSLKELAVNIHYKDWHSFLQRLPNVPELRSLYFPHIQEHIGGTYEPKELALQLVDIITLRPEVKLCYIGIRNKCFEVLECPARSGAADQLGSNGFAHHHHTGGAISVMDDEDNEDGSNNNSEADETEDDDDDAGTTASTPTDVDDDLTEVSDDVESDADNFEEPENHQSGTRLRLREILFYDDKVAIFKARHARL
ncbi:hypothetical protein JX265_010159 [Neoarthrinium moseri]|uniref:F-box domain-containing protein n=1 Tax=Neoarthrinium moseri TaxID=1658444 RepID=A0A9P9WEH6_9PEZI|nr:hypothetical protein JX265_010159 [Neoarthrinium moseri]